MSAERPMSLVILTYRRPSFLSECLESVLKSDLSVVREVLVAINGVDAETEAVASSAAARCALVRVEVLPRSSRGRARNLAAARARGRIIHFLDDDVIVPPHLFAATARRFGERPRAAAVGGPNLTPPGGSPFERAVGRALAARLGAWRMRARYAAVGEPRWTGEESLMLCSLALRADADGPGGLRFNERLASAEENLLLERIGGSERLFYDPRLSVLHRRRSDCRGFALQTFKSGAGRFQAATLLRSSLRPVHLAPAAFFLYLLILPFARRATGVAVPLWVYLALLGLECVAYARKDSARGAAWLALLIPLNHIAYAAGFLLGPFLWVKPEQEKSQRRSTTIAPPIPPPAQAASIP